MCRVWLELYERQCIGDSLYEFFSVHKTLCSPSVAILPMEALYGYLAQMLLHAKIDQLIILDHSIVVVIIPEDVFHKIGYFCLILLQNPNEEFPNFIRLELEISVRVEFYYLAVDHLAHRKGQLLCPELEFLLLETLTLQFDVTP